MKMRVPVHSTGFLPPLLLSILTHFFTENELVDPTAPRSSSIKLDLIGRSPRSPPKPRTIPAGAPGSRLVALLDNAYQLGKRLWTVCTWSYPPEADFSWYSIRIAAKLAEVKALRKENLRLQATLRQCSCRNLRLQKQLRKVEARGQRRGKSDNGYEK